MKRMHDFTLPLYASGEWDTNNGNYILDKTMEFGNYLIVLYADNEIAHSNYVAIYTSIVEVDEKYDENFCNDDRMTITPYVKMRYEADSLAVCLEIQTKSNQIKAFSIDGEYIPPTKMTYNLIKVFKLPFNALKVYF